MFLKLIVCLVSLQLSFGHHVIQADAARYEPTIQFTLRLRREFTIPSSSNFSAPIIEYVGDIGIGTPAKIFKFSFDTAFNENWLAKFSDQPGEDNLHHKDGYNPDQSRTGRMVDKKNVEFNYEGVNMKAHSYKDVGLMNVSKYNFEERRVKIGVEAEFLAVTQADRDKFKDRAFDGVVGLPAPGRHVTELETRPILFSLFLDRDEDTDLIDPEYPDLNNDRYMFGFWFNPRFDSSFGGEITFGGIDPTRSSEIVDYYPITGNDRWEIKMSAVSLGSRRIACENGCFAEFDTGDYYITGPKDDVQDIYKQLGARFSKEAGLWLVNCRSTEHFPNLRFRFRSKVYTLDPDHYITDFKHSGTQYCYVNINYWDLRREWKLGTSFLSAFYVVYDFNHEQIGIAKPIGRGGF